MMQTEEEFNQLLTQLSAHYIEVSKMYVRMSKTHDRHSIEVLESGISGRVQMANELRAKIEAKKKELLELWGKSRKDDPFPKSG